MPSRVTWGREKAACRRSPRRTCRRVRVREAFDVVRTPEVDASVAPSEPAERAYCQAEAVVACIVDPRVTRRPHAMESIVRRRIIVFPALILLDSCELYEGDMGTFPPGLSDCALRYVAKTVRARVLETPSRPHASTPPARVRLP